MHHAPTLLHFGTKVKALFTIGVTKRYGPDMSIFLAAAALVSPPSNAPFSRAAATAEARATVRIISAATLRLGEGPLNGDGPAAQRTIVHSAGAPHAAKLIEFE